MTSSETATRVEQEDLMDLVLGRTTEIRHRLFGVMGILDCAIATTNVNLDVGDPDVCYALRGAHDLLNLICSELDAAVLTKRPIRGFQTKL